MKKTKKHLQEELMKLLNPPEMARDVVLKKIRRLSVDTLKYKIQDFTEIRSRPNPNTKNSN